MKKIFVKLSMLLFVLVMSTTTWAGGISQMMDKLLPQEADSIMNVVNAVLTADPVYHAQLTGLASSTGGGKVYVTTGATDPRTDPYVPGTSNMATNGTNLAMRGVTDFPVYIFAWAKPDPGYWFVGWSFSDGGSELVSDSIPNGDYDSKDPESPQKVMPVKEEYLSAYDVSTTKNDTLFYTIYATFEPYRLSSYTIEGETTTLNGEASLNVNCTILGDGAQLSDFDTPEIVDQTGGTWTSGTMTLPSANTLRIPVSFTAENSNVGEFTAMLKVKTNAGFVLNVPLNVRTLDESPERPEAIRYNKNKVKYAENGEGYLSAMIAAAQEGDIIKLNQDINHQVVINTATKITLDLNGYTITHQLENYTYSPTTSDTDPSRLREAAILVYNASADVTLAYSPYGGKIIAGPWNDAIVMPLGGKLTLNGGTLVSNYFGIGAVGAEVIENGATIVGGGCAIASMNGTLTIKDGMMYGLVGSMSSTPANTAELVMDGGTIDNRAQTVEGMTIQGGIALQIGSGVATLNRGILIGQTSALNTVGKDLPATVTVEKNVVLKTTGEDTYALQLGGGTTTVNCAKFANPSSLCYFEDNVPESTLIFKSAYFLNETGAVGDEVRGKHLWRNTSGAESREGYNFFAGELSSAQVAGVSVCHIGGTSYSSLEDALAYANNTSEKVVIVMDNHYTLPAGYYTLPVNATLLVPYNNNQGSPTPLVDRVNKAEDPNLQTPREFRCLTFAGGVNMDVFGTIEVSGRQYSTGDLYTGAVYGPYGRLHLSQGSKIVLQSGSELRAWGYVTSGNSLETSGEIDVRRGAKVQELFQMGDWGSATQAAGGLLGGGEVFPLNTYFIQNVEAPAKYHPGAKLSSVTTVCEVGLGLTIMMSADNIQIIGVSRQEPLKSDTAMFLMDDHADSENTWVRKWYNPTTDQQVYEINSGAHIGSLVIPLVSSPLFPHMADFFRGEQTSIIGNILPDDMPESIVMNSGQYNLPITNNFKLHVLSGELDFTQNTILLPGSEVEVDKEATLSITKQPDINSGSLYVVDYRDWDRWAEGQYARIVSYSPTFNGMPDTREVEDIETIGSASVNVHGTFNTKYGFVFTSSNGGNIFSSIEDAGTFKFTKQLLGDSEDDAVDTEYSGDADDYTVNVSQKSGSIPFRPVWLKNAAPDDYVHAGAQAQFGDTYCYMDIDGSGARWTKLVQRGCFTVDAANVDEHTSSDIYYIKPQEYVAVVVNSAEIDDDKWIIRGNNDHTFSDAAGAGRLFILMSNEDTQDCQWWEVEQKDNYYHCIHPLNDTYYEWVDDPDEEDPYYGSWQEVEFTITWKDWNGSTITTYTVPYGTQAEWLSTNPTRAKNLDYTYDFTGWSPELGKVTSDVTYTATYEAKQIKYTITFIQDGGVEIERHLLARDEMPVCENEPTRTGYILQWEPALGPVTGNETYTATWLPAPPETYKVVWKNYDGDTLLITNPANGASAETVLATYTEADPTKEATTEYSYKFAGWKPALAAATANATYVAQFNEVEQTYEIKFYDEAGSNELKTENLTYGATPTPPTGILKSNPAAGTTYTYVWKTLDGTKNIETVTAAANYKPVFTGTLNKYTVTLRCNISGACAFTGAGIYEYGQSATIAATPADGYEFVKWSERGGGADLGPLTVSSDITLTAIVKETAVAMPGDLELGLDEAKTIAPATNYTDVIITSDGIEHSSQIINANNITLYGNADFVLQQAMTAGVWYSIAVPWRVEANGGIYLGGSSTPAVLGKDIEIIYYDGAVRAAQGKVDDCWVWMKRLSTKKVLEPGRAYMFLIRHGSLSKVTFRKKVQEPILTTTTSVSQYPSATATDANWNAIANPSLFHAFVNAGSDGAQAQRYNSAEDSYDWFDLNEHKLVVGEPIYVQAPAAKSIVVANGASYAPARRAKAQAVPTKYEVSITAAGATKYADHLSITLNEDKEENAYVIGQDLVKFGVSTKVAQMWINRYDAKLCVNTIAPEGDVTTFPMSIYAPKAGEYTIAIEREENTNDYALYLTYNGEAIWNLSDGAYTLNLNKGTISNYGLRVSARAPQVTTGVDEAIVEAQGETAMKVLINNQVFIIRGNRVYSVDGQLVK